MDRIRTVPISHALRATIAGSIEPLALYATTTTCQKTRRAVVVLTDQFFPVGMGTVTCPSGCFPGCATQRDFPGADDGVHAEEAALQRAGAQAAGGYVLHAKFDAGGNLVPSRKRFCARCVPLMKAARVEYLILYHADGWAMYRVADLPE